MGEFATTINDLVDSHGKEDEMEEEIRGVPESVQQSDLCKYAAQLLTSILPDLTELDITMDRIHCLPKPSYLPDNVPRDFILRLHFFLVKEHLMSASRNMDLFPPQYKDLQFFADLSQYTLQKCRNLNTISKALRSYKITYKWGFPTKLIITKEGKDHVVDFLAKGLNLHKMWHIVPEGSPQTSNPRSLEHIEEDWDLVTSRKACKHK